jgi:hypothetical protein
MLIFWPRGRDQSSGTCKVPHWVVAALEQGREQPAGKEARLHRRPFAR